MSTCYAIEKVAAEREAARAQGKSPAAQENIAASAERVKEIRAINRECREMQLAQRHAQGRGQNNEGKQQ